jgi:hypothetical protein
MGSDDKIIGEATISLRNCSPEAGKGLGGLGGLNFVEKVHGPRIFRYTG